MMSENFRLGFLGAGNMAEAIVKGLISSNTLAPSLISLFDIRTERLDQLHTDLSVNKSESMEALFSNSDYIVMAVKPQNVTDLSEQLKRLLAKDKTVISIMAGVTCEKLESVFRHSENQNPMIIRCMPNTPALVQKGVSAIAAGSYVPEDKMRVASKIMGAVGTVDQVDEKLIDAVTGLTGSGPAYIFKMMESLITAGIEEGLPPKSVPKMVKNLVAGAAELALQSDVEPDELRRRVTSPNGTTQAGLEAMDAAGFENAVRSAVKSATERSIELSKESS